jgi:hypothetical protein
VEAGATDPAELTSPTPGTTLTGSSATFTWTTGTGLQGYQLYLGTSVGANDLYSSGVLTTTSVTVTGLPTYGAVVYSTLRSQTHSGINGGWENADNTYKEAGTPLLATMITPAAGSTLSGSSVTFTWTKGGGVTGYLLWLGSTPGAHDVYDSGVLTVASATSLALINLPTSGVKIYVTLYSETGGGWKSVPYTYTEAP